MSENEEVLLSADEVLLQRSMELLGDLELILLNSGTAEQVMIGHAIEFLYPNQDAFGVFSDRVQSLKTDILNSLVGRGLY